MKRMVWICAGAAIAALLATLLGCNGAKSGKKEVVLGAILPMTGPSAVLGEFNKHGMDLAVEEWNTAKKPEEPSLRIEYADSKNDAKEGILAFQALTGPKKVGTIVAAMSSVTNALIQPASESGSLLFATTVSAEGITQDHPRMFRLFIRADIDARTMAEYAARTLKMKRVAILYVQDDFGASFRDVFKRSFEQEGGSIVAEEGCDRAMTDYRATLTRLKTKSFEGIYVLAYEKTMGLIPKQMRELGMNQPIFSIGTIAQPYVLQQAGSAVDGAYFTSTDFDAEAPRTDLTRSFVQKFEAKYGKKPNYFNAFAYDTIRVLAKAAGEAAGNTPEDLSKALLTVKDYPGTVGPITFEPSGDAAFPMRVRRIEKGRIVDAPSA